MYGVVVGKKQISRPLAACIKLLKKIMTASDYYVGRRRNSEKKDFPINSLHA